MIELETNSLADLKKEGKSFYWASFFLPRNLKIKAGILYSICRHFDDVADKLSKDQTSYLKNSIEEIKKNPDYDFVCESGRKYYKIVMVNNQRSVHAFIDKRTGEVYKPAGWQGPAKHVRYDLRLIKDREYVLENCDWAGGYLYMK